MAENGEVASQAGAPEGQPQLTQDALAALRELTKSLVDQRMDRLDAARTAFEKRMAQQITDELTAFEQAMSQQITDAIADIRKKLLPSPSQPPAQLVLSDTELPSMHQIEREEFEKWSRANLPRGFKNEWAEASLNIINGGHLIGVDFGRIWSQRHDVLAIQLPLNRMRFVIAGWIEGGLDQNKAEEYLRNELAMRMCQMVMDGTLDLQAYCLAILRNPQTDMSPYVNPERIRFDTASSRSRHEAGRPQDDRLMYRLLVTPYARVIEEEVEAELNGRKGAPIELDRARRKVGRIKEQAVNRAWNSLTESMEGPTFALFLALQFCIAKYTIHGDSTTSITKG